MDHFSVRKWYTFQLEYTDGKVKVEYCFFIEMKDGNWNRTKETIKMKSDFKGYIRDKVTYYYADNPESNRIEKLMKKRMDKGKI